MSKSWAKLFAGAVLALYCAGVAHYLASNPDRFGWDFKAYYDASGAYLSGIDPYAAVFQAGVQGHSSPRGVKFYYPPFALWLFAPLSLMSYEAAWRFFFYAKCVAAAGLISLWAGKFLKAGGDIVFYLFCLLVFNACLFLDFRAGNVSVFEQLALWWGLYFFINDRLFPFCLLILAASVFKITPLFFLLLLWFSKDGQRFVWLGASVSIVVLTAACSYFWNPALWTAFFHNLGWVLDNKVIMNQPSTYDLAGDVLLLLRLKWGLAAPRAVQTVVWGAVAAAVPAISWRALAALKSSGRTEAKEMAVFISCLVYALIIPNFEDYSYIILIVPAYWMLRRAGAGNFHVPGAHYSDRLLTFLFVILSAVTIPLPGIRPVIGLALAYSPLMLAYVIWGLYMRECHVFAGAPRDGKTKKIIRNH